MHSMLTQYVAQLKHGKIYRNEIHAIKISHTILVMSG